MASACLFALVLAGCASSAKEISKGDASRVRVVKDTSLVRDCQVLGTVADNDFEDLQKKAARLGGNVVLLTPERAAKGGYFGLQDYMTADVYRCESAR
jgi:starvation-inducible outer membrane lipoprotein